VARSEAAAASTAAATRRRGGDALFVAGTLAVTAGLIHVKAMADHVAHYWLFGVLFGVVACAQIGWGVWLWRRPMSNRALVAGAIGTLGVIGVWVVSRTVGLPIGPWAGEAEEIGVSDAIATLAELALLPVVVAIVRPGSRIGIRLAWLSGGQAVRISAAFGSAAVLAALGGHAH
jgi:hypothetical protein